MDVIRRFSLLTAADGVVIRRSRLVISPQFQRCMYTSLQPRPVPTAFCNFSRLREAHSCSYPDGKRFAPEHSAAVRFPAFLFARCRSLSGLQNAQVTRHGLQALLGLRRVSNKTLHELRCMYIHSPIAKHALSGMQQQPPFSCGSLPRPCRSFSSSRSTPTVGMGSLTSDAEQANAVPNRTNDSDHADGGYTSSTLSNVEENTTNTQIQKADAWKAELKKLGIWAVFSLVGACLASGLLFSLYELVALLCDCPAPVQLVWQTVKTHPLVVEDIGHSWFTYNWLWSGYVDDDTARITLYLYGIKGETATVFANLYRDDVTDGWKFLLLNFYRTDKLKADKGTLNKLQEQLLPASPCPRQQALGQTAFVSDDVKAALQGFSTSLHPPSYSPEKSSPAEPNSLARCPPCGAAESSS